MSNSSLQKSVKLKVLQLTLDAMEEIDALWEKRDIKPEACHQLSEELASWVDENALSPENAEMLHEVFAHCVFWVKPRIPEQLARKAKRIAGQLGHVEKLSPDSVAFRHLRRFVIEFVIAYTKQPE